MSLRLACGALVLVVGALLLAVFPLAFLDGSAAFWARPSGDLAEHTIGARYFLADVWRWPLLYVPALGAPDGVNIGLTDSIPAVALLAKLLHWPFQRSYFPVWIAFCYLAQGPAGAIALRTMGVKRPVPLFLGGLLLVFTPVLLYRFGHAALNGHFLILLALAVHARIVQARQGFWWYVPLLGLALLVHIYLFAMVFALLVASLLHALWTNRLTVAGAFGILAADGAAVALPMAACGYLSLGPIPMKPYGEYALNLAAPFLPGPSGLFGIAGPPFEIGYESVCWFGAGMALAMLAALVGERSRLLGLTRGNVPTLAVAAALIVFAATYAVRAGPYLVLGITTDTARRHMLEGYPLTLADIVRMGLYIGLILVLAVVPVVLAWRQGRTRVLVFVAILAVSAAAAAVLRPMAVALLISSFQASARFVWVVLYLAALLAIAGVCRAYRPPVATALLAIALVLQVADTEPFWRIPREDAATVPPAFREEATVAAAIQSADRVVVVPTYLCAYAEPLDPAEHDALVARVTAVDELVSRWVKQVNSVRHSRQSVTDRATLQAFCAEQRRNAAAHAGEAGRLTLVLSGCGPAQPSVLCPALTSRDAAP